MSSVQTFDVHSEIALSKLYHKHNDNVSLSRWRMNLLTIIHEPYLWLCVAMNKKILIYKLNVTPSNLKPEPIYDLHQHLLPESVFTKYSHNPMGYCIVKSIINHIDSLQHKTNPLLFSCQQNGTVSIFDCNCINNDKLSLSYSAIMEIDNNEFIPNSPISSTHHQFNDYSVWSLDVIRSNDNDENNVNNFFLGFGSNTHYLRVFKIYNNYKNGEWLISSLSHGIHDNNVPDVTFSNDHLYIASVAIDGILRIWKNNDYNKNNENDDISRIISEQQPILTYNEFGSWFGITSHEYLWSVIWIDINSISLKTQNKIYHDNDDNDDYKENVSKTKKMYKIGNKKFISLKNKLKIGRRNTNKSTLNDNKQNEYPYVDIFNFDPSDYEYKDDDDDDLDEYKEEEEKVNDDDDDDYLMIICSETQLYVMRMNVNEIKEELSINDIYTNIEANYINDAMGTDRLQFLKYIPSLKLATSIKYQLYLDESVEFLHGIEVED